MPTDNPTYIEIYRDGEWHVAATLEAMDANRCRIDYVSEYLFATASPLPIALGMPLGHAPDRFIEGPMGPEPDRRPPAFLYDLVPQGRGRQFLVDRLKLSDDNSVVMPLVMAGAFNPIGCLRLQSAMSFYRHEAELNPDRTGGRGFDLQDILGRSGEFLDHLSVHAMLASGTTGVQGAAPKFLLVTDEQERWYADMALPDGRAREHWLLKRPRSKSDDDRAVLRNEAGYLRLAAECGLRTAFAPKLHGEVLFVRRFDREVDNGVLYRLHQESLASVCDLRGFAAAPTQQTLLAGLRSVVDDPMTETIEFMRRDVLNLAMRNTDNHARNTAVQRLRDGRIQLTPVFDFAPMFLDTEMIARVCHWKTEQGKVQHAWSEIIEGLAVSDDECHAIAQALHAFAPVVARIPDVAEHCGVEPRVLELCRRSIDEQVRQLEALRPLTSNGPGPKGERSHGG